MKIWEKIVPQAMAQSASIPEADNINQYNPLALGGNGAFGNPGAVTIGDIVSRILLFLYPIITILLFILLLWGGIEYMMAGVNSKSTKAEVGKKRIIAALTGFIIVATSFVIMKLIGAAFGITLPF